MTVNIDNKRRRISAKADEEEEKQRLHHLSISQSVITVNNEKNMKRRKISSKEEEKCTHLSNLFPHDIMLDIISRLPVKPLMRFRSVSKSWNYLIRKDQFFINMHLCHAKLHQHEKMILTDLECHYRLYSLDYNQGSNRLERLTHHNSRLRHIHRDHNYIWGSCNGLICTGGIGDYDLFISNPSTTEYRKIPYFNGVIGDSCYGFGYNPNANDYVLVQLTDWRTSTERFNSTVAIYSLRNNSWKKLQNIPYLAKNLDRPGEFLYGSLHWVAHSKFIKLEYPTDSYSEDSDGECFARAEENTILAFEITTEKFVEVLCPDIDHGIMIVGQYQGKLCFYLEKMSVEDSFDLWVMNEYKVRESWSKVFNIQKPGEYPCTVIMRVVLASTKEGYILMRSSMFGKEHMILYDPKQKTRRQILGIEVWGMVIYYVPSIVAFDF